MKFSFGKFSITIGGNPAPGNSSALRVAQLHDVAKKYMTARYDAAQTTRENQRHWMMSDGLSADQANSPGVREVLRNRSRYECANSTFLKHMVRVNSFYMVGRCPQLEITNTPTVSEPVAQRIESGWNDWAKREKLGRQLRIMVQAADRDGESFMQMYTNRKHAAINAVSLSVTTFEAQYVRNFSNVTADEYHNVDGINLDDDGNVYSYNVQTNPYLPPVIIPAAQIIHYFKPDRPGQHRGIPETAAGLNLSAYRRDYTLSVVQSARNAADMSLFLQSDIDLDEDGATQIGKLDEDIGAFETMPVDLSRASLNILPSGTTPNMLKAEQPVNTYSDFNRETLTADAAGFSMPINIASCNSSKYNFASGKLDFQFFSKKIRIDQYDFDLYVLDPIFSEWFAEFKLLPENQDLVALPLPEHEWMYDSAEPIDPQKEAGASTARLTNGTSNLALECARFGLDWRNVANKAIQIEQYIAEERRKAGLPPAVPLAAPDKTQPPAPPSSDDDESGDSPSPANGDNNE